MRAHTQTHHQSVLYLQVFVDSLDLQTGGCEVEQCNRAVFELAVGCNGPTLTQKLRKSLEACILRSLCNLCFMSAGLPAVDHVTTCQHSEAELSMRRAWIGASQRGALSGTCGHDLFRRAELHDAAKSPSPVVAKTHPAMRSNCPREN